MPFHKPWIEMMREGERRCIETKVVTTTWKKNEPFIHRAIEREREEQIMVKKTLNWNVTKVFQLAKTWCNKINCCSFTKSKTKKRMTPQLVKRKRKLLSDIVTLMHNRAFLIQKLTSDGLAFSKQIYTIRFLYFWDFVINEHRHSAKLNWTKELHFNWELVQPVFRWLDFVRVLHARQHICNSDTKITKLN